MSTKSSKVANEAKTSAIIERVNIVTAVCAEVQKVFDVSNVKDIQSVKAFCQQMDAVRGRTLLPECKLMQRVRDCVLWKSKYKNYQDFASKERGLKKQNAYNYANVGTLVTEDGAHSIFYVEGSKARDFEYAQLLAIYESGIDLEKIRELVADFKVNPAQTVKEIKKTLETYAGNDLTDDTEVTEETTEETEEIEETEETEETEESNETTTIYNALKAILNRYKDNKDFQDMLFNYDRKMTEKENQ